MDKHLSETKKYYTDQYLTEMVRIKGPWSYFKKGLLEAHLRERATVNIFRHFEEKELKKINTILDLGCGEGHKLAFSGRLLNSPDLHGIDILEDRLKQGMELYPQIHFLNHPMQQKLPYDNGKFDLVSAFVSLMFLKTEEDIDATFTEVNRVLKSKAYFLVSELNEKHFSKKLTEKGHAGFTISELDKIASRHNFEKQKTIIYSRKLIADVFRISVWTSYTVGIMFNICPFTKPLNFLTLYKKGE